MPVGDQPIGLTLADLNGDGKPELTTANFGANNVSVLINVSPVPSGVPPSATVPAFQLATPRPNPSSGPLQLDFSLPGRGRATMAVYDAQGRLVRTLVDGVLGAGPHSLVWDGRNSRGRTVPAGRYFLVVSDATGRLRFAPAAIVR